MVFSGFSYPLVVKSCMKLRWAPKVDVAFPPPSLPTSTSLPFCAWNVGHDFGAGIVTSERSYSMWGLSKYRLWNLYNLEYREWFKIFWYVNHLVVILPSFLHPILIIAYISLVQWATKLLRCFGHSSCLLYNYWSTLDIIFKKYELESPWCEVLYGVQVDYIISIFSKDIMESIYR